MNGLETLDRYDLLMIEERSLRGNGRQLRKSICCKDIMKNSFKLYRGLEGWNDLEREVVQAKTVSEFKVKLDESGSKECGFESSCVWSTQVFFR